MIRVLAALALVVALATGAVAKLALDAWRQPFSLPADGYTLTVAPGETLASVALRLEADGVYPHPWLLRVHGRYTGQDALIRRGEYRLEGSVTAEALLLLLQSGRVITYQVTLPEGITLSRAIALLGAHERLTADLSGVGDARIEALVAQWPGPEGLFFPDTYQFEAGTTDWEVLQRAHGAMLAILDEEWQQRAPDLPYANPYEALVMASIIERETGLPAERGEIAGVFVRRLQRGMRLQTDPTIIYGLGDDYAGDITRAHLKDEGNPYNTYQHDGLPPTPIALPGRDAIRAALNPEQGTSLFFVARGDGGHYFSDTLAEHQRAVRKYQLNRRADYRSSPEK